MFHDEGREKRQTNGLVWLLRHQWCRGCVKNHLRTRGQNMLFHFLNSKEMSRSMNMDLRIDNMPTSHALALLEPICWWGK